jgi:hypothetical protein
MLAYPNLALEFSQVLIGLTPGGRELARYRVPVSGSPVIDRAGHAWMTDFQRPDTGLALRSISLRSGAVRKYSAFTGIKLVMSGIKLDTRGNVLLVGEPEGGRGDGNLVMARITRDGVVGRPVHWPRRLSYPLGADFAVDRHGDVWLGYLGGMARIDANGNVAAFPLSPEAEVLFVEATSDGHIVFNALSAPHIATFAPSAKLRGTTFIGEFDPEHPTKLPTLQREPTVRSGAGYFGWGRRRNAVITDPEAHKVFDVPLTVPPSATPPPLALKAAVRRIIAEHQAALVKIRLTWDKHLKRDGSPYVRATMRLIAQTRTRLLVASSQSPTVPDPRISRLITRAATDGRYAVSDLKAMAQPPIPTLGAKGFGDFAASYQFIAAQFTADLYETAEAFGLPPIDYNGRTTWRPERP